MYFSTYIDQEGHLRSLRLSVRRVGYESVRRDEPKAIVGPELKNVFFPVQDVQFYL